MPALAFFSRAGNKKRRRRKLPAEEMQPKIDKIIITVKEMTHLIVYYILQFRKQNTYKPKIA